ncbi:Rho-binding antiterminator [Pseudoalteromonas sp. SG45-5]|uniref:Rho-binding antiterminator n=1 Tax=unclassified Pseudoalteromonas TaxID=194690 RepID=UPI0015FB7F5F|nr:MULTISPECIES: Rho-binding antiterminator [unclassified Pseudoalteromonas]MBB1386735.1 Rho-binding antiterminator [Pseudoalteromonas sp. SG45-5]MBB1394835.1 Rho-binding antiterminator [Pseudoalteromonas sp. SG44-4]MBB1449263.1 Rho-binding antiterminator [Pseudoalteromonas sp. SG41-6]
MISCDQHDYVEIACMNRLHVEIVLKSGDTVRGIATDTKRNANREECIVVNVNSELQLIVLTTISVLKSCTQNRYFDQVSFDSK